MVIHDVKHPVESMISILKHLKTDIEELKLAF